MSEQLEYWLNSPQGCVSMACEGQPCKLRKEVAYTAKFVKRAPDNTVEYALDVTPRLIHHWVKTFNEMKQDGIEVPVPVGHTTDASKRVGTVTDLEAVESQHGMSLFANIQFHSPEDAQRYAHSDVSLYTPPAFTSGRDKKYIRPIRHVCITDYPVIPGLEKFAPAMAFSLDSESDVVNDDAIVALAERLGIPLPDGATAADAEQAILEAFEALANPPEPDQDEEEAPPEMDPAASPQMSFSAPHTLVSMVSKTRSQMLEQLVRDRKITPPVADAFRQLYATPKAVGVSMSLEAQGFEPDDFEPVAHALSLLPSLAAPTPSRPLPKSGGTGDDLLAIATARAAAAQSARTGVRK